MAVTSRTSRRAGRAGFGLKGNSRFYNETVSDQGVAKQFRDDYATSYFTGVVKNESMKWIGSVLGKGKPVFCSIHVPAPHRPATPAPQYADDFADEKAPRTPNWNGPGTQDKHVSSTMMKAKMDADTFEYSDHVWRRRLRSLKSVDDLVAEVFALLKSTAQLERTVFVYR